MQWRGGGETIGLVGSDSLACGESAPQHCIACITLQRRSWRRG